MTAKTLRKIWMVMYLGLVQILAQAQGFNRHYDAYNAGFYEQGWDIEPAGNGWMVFSGSFEPDTLGPDSIVGVYVALLQRLDEEGNLTLEKRIQLPGHSIYLGWADCCDTTAADDGYVISGSSGEYYTEIVKARLMRLTAIGDTLWTRSYGSIGDFWIGSQVKQTPDGGFLICGYTGPTTGSHFDGFALKADSLGNEAWRHTYGLGALDEDLACIALVPNGFVLSGVTTSTSNSVDFWITKINNEGTVIWTNRFGSPFEEPEPTILHLEDGRLVLAGAWAANSNVFMTPYLAFIDTANGDVLNSHLYGVPHYSTTLFAAKQFSNSDIILAGVSYSEGPQQGLLIRTTSDGNSLWMRNYFYYDADVEEGQGRFFDVLPTADNGCIAAGVAYNPVNAPYPPGHSQDTWVVKVDSMGCVVPGCDGITGITEQVTNLTRALHLYPNPVHGLLHVGIELPPKLTTSGPLTLTVTSLSGQVVLQEQVPSSAPDEVELDVGHFAAGTYALHLSDAHTWLAGAKFVVE